MKISQGCRSVRILSKHSTSGKSLIPRLDQKQKCLHNCVWLNLVQVRSAEKTNILRIVTLYRLNLYFRRKFEVDTDFNRKINFSLLLFEIISGVEHVVWRQSKCFTPHATDLIPVYRIYRLPITVKRSHNWKLLPISAVLNLYRDRFAFWRRHASIGITCCGVYRRYVLHVRSLPL